MSIGEQNKTLYLWLLRTGGWWTTAEIAMQLQRSKVSLNTALQRMKIKNFVKQAEPAEGELLLRYGVTGDCAVPAGVFLGEVQL